MKEKEIKEGIDLIKSNIEKTFNVKFATKNDLINEFDVKLEECLKETLPEHFDYSHLNMRIRALVDSYFTPSA